MADITPVIRDTDAVTISPGSGVTITRSGAAGSYVYTIDSTGGSLEVRVNGTAKGTRPAIDFTDSASLAWTVTDDAGNNDVNISGTVIAGGAASDLATTGAAVNVSAASPPSGAGQVLTSTDATHATWQTPSGGAPSTAEYLVGAADAGLSAERVVTATATVSWDLSGPGTAKANVIPSGITMDALADPVAAVAFAQQQATGFVIENRTSDPGSPVAGQVWLRTDL